MVRVFAAIVGVLLFYSLGLLDLNAFNDVLVDPPLPLHHHGVCLLALQAFREMLHQVLLPVNTGEVTGISDNGWMRYLIV